MQLKRQSIQEQFVFCTTWRVLLKTLTSVRELVMNKLWLKIKEKSTLWLIYWEDALFCTAAKSLKKQNSYSSTLY